MAQRDKEKHKNNNDKNNDNNKKKEDNFIRVPTTDMRVMAGAQVVVGGDRPANITTVHNLNIPISRNIEIDLVEVLVTEGPYKGATVYHPYPRGADIRLFKTPEMAKALAREARREKIRGWFDSLISKVSFGVL